MKKGLTMIMAAFFLVFMLGGSSLAAPINGAIWQITGYNQTTYTQIDITPAAPVLAQFTVNAMNFDSEALTGSYGGSVTYAQFLSNSLSGAPGPNGLAWDNSVSETFGSQTLLTDSTYTSFFMFTGTAYFQDTFTIRHDDGFVLYIYAYGDKYDFSYPTAPEVANISLATYGLTAGTYAFQLNYAAWNGFPEVLQVQTPEPITMLLLSFGLVGLAGVRKFKK